MKDELLLIQGSKKILINQSHDHICYKYKSTFFFRTMFFICMHRTTLAVVVVRSVQPNHLAL